MATTTIRESDEAVSDDRTPLQTALVRGGVLTAVTAALWALLAGPAWLLGGIDGIEGLSYAAGLCLVPGWVVFLLIALYGTAGTQAAMVALGGTALRLVFVLVGVLAIRAVRPHLGFWDFIVWLLVFYMATLFVETLLVVRQK